MLLALLPLGGTGSRDMGGKFHMGVACTDGAGGKVPMRDERGGRIRGGGMVWDTCVRTDGQG